MLETSEQRTKLLKAGFSGKEIERLYIEYNNFKIVYHPILFEISEFNEVKMKKLKMPDKKYEEIENTLISLGMNRNVAMTLVYMQNVNSATMLDIERSNRLHKPEVSIAMRRLKEKDWINVREEKKPGKGRPYKIYSLKVGFDEIIAQLEKQHKKSSREVQEQIERLKELGTYKR